MAPEELVVLLLAVMMEFYVTMLQMLQFHSTQPTSKVAMRQMTLLIFVREILTRMPEYRTS
jgi:hypothetical protein